MPVLSLRDITKTYKSDAIEVPALRGVDMDIERGEHVALMGPSGSGKSTLMNILGCLDRPTSGSYLFEDREVTELADDELAWLRGRRIGFVFQHYNLVGRTTARENVAMPLLYQRMTNGHERVQHVMEQVGIAHRAKHFPSQLSGGEAQRVAIARALVLEPAILLADEPTGNLDTKTGGEILELFDRLVAEGRTLIVVTHDPNVAARAKRAVHIQDGRIDEAAS